MFLLSQRNQFQTTWRRHYMGATKNCKLRYRAASRRRRPICLLVTQSRAPRIEHQRFSFVAIMGIETSSVFTRRRALTMRVCNHFLTMVPLLKNGLRITANR